MTTFFKKSVAFFSSFLLLFSLASCKDTSTEPVESIVLPSVAVSSAPPREIVNIAIPASPAGISAAALLEKSAGDVTLDNYIGSVFPTDEEVASHISDGSADVALLPVDEAVQLYQSSEGEIQLLAILSQSDLSIVTSDESISSLSDLSGKTITATDEDGLTGAALTVLLEKAFVTSTVDYVANGTEVTSTLTADENDIVCLDEPATSETLADESFVAPIQLSTAWSENFDGNYFPYACLVVRKSFADSNPDKITKLLEEFEESTTIASDDALSTAMFCERHEILSLALAQEVIPRCKPLFLTGAEMKDNTSTFFEILLQSSPTFLEDGAPADDFYRSETISPAASLESTLSENAVSSFSAEETVSSNTSSVA